MKITLLKSLLLLGAFLCFGMSQAQEVSGTVSDASGPLPGASVLEKGTTNGTQTDFDGNYTLEVEDGAVLVVSYIGFKSQEAAVNGRTSINFTLEEDAQALEEVVIIGYGTTTVKDATGSVTSVTSEDFNGGVIASPEQLIQGKTAGVNIQQTSGEPGAGIQINIRGSNSVRANNSPLFVVDGIPLSGGGTAPSGDTGFGGTAVKNPLNFLNPQDIASMSILKDASATAIYGSRGANGVVIITTKSGKSGGQGILEFNSTLSVATPANTFDLLNRSQYLSAVTQYGGDANAVDFGADTDWQDQIFRTAASQNQNLSYSKNYGKGNVRATFGYGKQFGVVEKTDLERITGRLNLNHRFLDDKLLLGIQTSVSRINDQTAPLAGTAGASGDLLGGAYAANPTWPGIASFDAGGLNINPLNLLQNTQNITNTNRYLINGSLEYKFTPQISAKLNAGWDYSDGENTSVTSRDVQNIADAYNGLTRDNKTLEATVNFAKEFDDSNLSVLVGYAYQDFNSKGFFTNAKGFGTGDLNQMGVDLRNVVDGAQGDIGGSFQQFYYDGRTNGYLVNRLFSPSGEPVAGEPVASSISKTVQAVAFDNFDNTDELQSFFARAEYAINNKYIITGTIRADGSSRFGPENQYGYFPSGAVAWKLSEEDFVGENISTLKLRLSAGITGNQDGLGYGNFVARERFSGLGRGNIQNGNLEINQNGLVIVATDRPDLKWEESLNFNVGLDFGFNNDRFSGSLDVYRTETTDLLLQTPPAAPAVDPFQFGNVDATVLNQGVELGLSYDFIRTDDVNFSADFNVAYNFNEVQDFEGDIDSGPINGQGLTGAFAQRFSSGQSLFSYYMPIFEGFDSSGFPTYRDVDGNGVGDAFGDRTFVGEDGLPDITSGLSLNLKVKNFDASAFFSGQFGFSVYNNTANGFFNAGSISSARNVTQDVLTNGEAPGASADVSTRFLEKGDFVRFQNLNVGYNVPVSGEGVLKTLRFSLTGQNLFLITDYSGLDPEVTSNTGQLNSSGVPSRGIDYAAYPNPRTFTLGINASF
jgi:iron complex outermembrane receptor protein